MDELELVLDDCLQRLASGKSSLAQCLARYPQYAAELRPSWRRPCGSARAGRCAPPAVSATGRGPNC